jgi:NAD dependent epimerase/dehydratase family enzyme
LFRGLVGSEMCIRDRVMPQALTDAGFTWDYPHITNALTALVQE